MITGITTIDGPVGLICPLKIAGKFDSGLTDFLSDLNTLAAAGALPITLEQTAQDRMVLVHTRRYVATLFVTDAGDAYRIGRVFRRGFRDESRLVKRALLLRCPPGFRVYADLIAFNLAKKHYRFGFAAWPQLWHAWQSLPTPQPPKAPLPEAHERYLDLLGRLVEAGRQIEIQRQSSAPPVPYASFTDAKVQRYSVRGAYTFRVLSFDALSTNTLVCLGERPEMRGRVIQVDGLDVIVRFEPGADFRRIGAQGTLRLLPSDRVYRALRDAIEALRRGESRHPGLLAVLAERRFEPYPLTGRAKPQIDLDPGQLEAFHRAVDVPDLLCVLGPPGTGKTTTITEVVMACVALGQKVLVTSHTHRAVDNVLEKLPPAMNVVRIGNEDSMTPEVRVRAAENRVELLRKRIKGETALLDRLTEFERLTPLVQQYLTHLSASTGGARSAESALGSAESTLSAAVDRAASPLRPHIATAQHTAVTKQSELDRLLVSITSWDGRLRSAQTRAESGSLLAFAIRWYAGRTRSKLDAARQSVPAVRSALADAQLALQGLRTRAEAMAAADPHVARLVGGRDAARNAVVKAREEVSRAAATIRSILSQVVSTATGDPTTWDGWDAFHKWATDTSAMLGRRLLLLKDWRKQINDLSVDLEREIARHADVVGATCIGTDTSALIADLTFDLAIVDEAGQISAPNLLVPLVRSKRAMLVGDHKQLPPYLDDEIRRWSTGLGRSDDFSKHEIDQISDLLTKSGFELIFPHAPSQNAVWLIKQRRMPRAVATFVSNTFYHKRLETEHKGARPDPVFHETFAMIDTSDRDDRERFETRPRRTDPLARHGYRNELEAEIIARLMSRYHKHYADWAVIVPFNLQKELLIDRLSQELGHPGAIAGNVGTVDSFQGGERQLIIFGFTRSNDRGDIGFLSELRRFNVAISRAKAQLVLVGDLSTLHASRDRKFRELMHSVSGYVSKHGDMRLSRSAW